MADSDKNVAYGVSADATPFEKGLKDAADAAKGFSSTVDSNFKKVQDAFANVQKQLLVLAGIVAGGSFFKDAIAASNKLTGETMQLSKSLAITGEEAATLRTALDDIGSSGEDYVATFTKFARQLKSNEAGLQALGLQTRDANGNLRDSNTLFTEALQSVGQYKAGLDQNTYAQTVFGKSIDDVMKLQKLNTGVLEEARKKNEELGLTVSQDNVAASKAYKMAMNDVGDVLLAVKKTIGDAVMPVFTELGEYFASTGPYVVQVFKGAMMGLLTVFEVVRAAVKTVAGVVFEAFSLIVDGAGLIGDVFARLFAGDFSGAYNAAKQVGTRVAQAFSGAFANFLEAGNAIPDAIDAHARRLYAGGAPIAAPKSGGKTMGEFGKADGGADKSRMGAWEAELAEAKLAFQEQANLQGSFAQYSKATELQFWRDKLGQTQRGGAENIAIRRKLADMELAMGQEAYAAQLANLAAQAAAYRHSTTERLAVLQQEATLARQRYGEQSKEFEEVQKKIVATQRQAAEQRKQMDMDTAQAARDADLAQLQARQQAAQLDRELGTITQAQLLQQLARFEDERAALVLAGLQERERIALADPDRDPVELNRLQLQIQQAEREHQARLGEIRMQGVRESNRYTLDAINATGAAWQSVFAKAMQGSLSLRGVFQGLWQGVTQAISQALAKMAAEWLMVHVKNMLLGRVAAQSAVAQQAAEAGAGGVASMAAAPFPLNLSAPAFGAAMAAAASAFAPMASAAGGYDIPGTLNPITQLHAREMVLPAKHADVIRNLADGGSPAGGGDSYTVHVHATDAQSVARLFRDNGDALVRALAARKRDFAG